MGRSRTQDPQFKVAFAPTVVYVFRMPSSVFYSCALITGASSGLGEEFALQLAPQVGRLVLVARRQLQMEELAVRILAEFPEIDILVFVGNLTISADRVRLSETLAARGWAPDLLVNNAGLGDYGEFASAEWSKIESMLRVNMEALTHLTHLFIPSMISNSSGAVLNVSSLASLMPIPDLAVYAATKAYVTSFSEALRIELRGHGINVLAVCPGPVHTGFGAAAQRSASAAKIPGRECFYVPKEQVVEESLAALWRKRARVYPGLRTAAVAVLISAAPIVLLRCLMSFRPRKAE